MERTEWLSEGAERLAFELLRSDRPRPDCDIAIVGSGYGGAVAAARLAGRKKDGKPAKVWLLERGREFVPGSFPERLADLPAQVRVNFGEEPQSRGQAEGLFDVRVGKHVSALLGNGLGGGSLINAGVLARPSDPVLEHWPQELRGKALEAYFEKAETMLGAAKLPGPAPAKLVAIEALGRKLEGRDADRRASIAVSFADGSEAGRTNRWGAPQRKCIRCGDCFSGCNHWAKNTLAMNYLPLARRRGARLITGVTVLALKKLEVEGEQCWELQVHITDPQVARRCGAGKENPLRLVARQVILAAGAYGSTGILLRSREQGLAVSCELGERFSTNGDMIAVGYRMPERIYASARETVEPQKRNIGPTITGMIDMRNREGLVIEELAIPAMLRHMFEEIVTNLGTLHGLAETDCSRHRRDEVGPDPAAIDQDAVERTAVYATIGHDGSAGSIRLIKNTAALLSDDGVRVHWEKVGDTPIFATAIRVLERAHEGTGATVIPNPLWKLLPERLEGMLEGPAVGGNVFTTHPLGGCAMAETAEHGVVNHLGQVYKAREGRDAYETLAVLDGSIVPGSLGINPCLTIAALAEYAIERLATNWGLQAFDDSEATVNLLPKPPEPLPLPDEPPSHRPTEIRLAERLTGRLGWPVEYNGGGAPVPQQFDAKLEIEYDSIPHLEAFLAVQPKILGIAKGRLELRGTLQRAGVHDATEIAFSTRVGVKGELRMFARENTTALGRICRGVWAWFWNRGLREIWQGAKTLLRRILRRLLKGPNSLSRSESAGSGSLLSKFLGLLAVASHAGEVRRLEYEMVVMDDVAIGATGSGGEIRLLAKGDRLRGAKRVAYLRGVRPYANPWDQFMRLPLTRVRQRSGGEMAIGTLEVDLPYFVTQYATQVQLLRQENQPDAIADLFSLTAYLARLIGQIHIWTFRAPEYPDLIPYKRDADEERRLPADLQGLTRHTFDVPVGPPGVREGPRIRLTRYVAEKPSGKPVLLIHGFGASGTTFTLTTVDQNLVQHLAGLGFEPWVLDLRTSIGLPSSNQEWTFDEVAREDIPVAIQKVLDETKAPEVNVVAHCVGAAMFCMAALGNKLKRGSIRAAVLSQVGPLLELPPVNRFRGYIASYLKHYLDLDDFNVTAAHTPGNRFIDRLLAAYPYPEREWRAHHPRWFWQSVKHEVYCNRASSIYGRLFEHANLNERTLDSFGDLIGHIKYKTYQQTIFYATMRRLTDPHGKNAYVKYENIVEHFDFPVCFLHGEKNDVFDVKTSLRSFDLLASVFWTKDMEDAWALAGAERSGHKPYRGGKHVRMVEIENYGHQDCMIGHLAHRDVYPEISGFLKDSEKAPNTASELDVVRPALMGPIIGWIRLKNCPGEAVPQPVVRILFAPNNSRSEPLYAMTIVLADGKPVEDFDKVAKFHELREKPIPWPQAVDRSSQQPIPPTQAVDVWLPDAPCDYQVVVLTVHKEAYEAEPKRDVGEPPSDDPFGEDLDRFPLLPEGKKFPGKKNAARASAEEFVQPVLETCKDRGFGGEWLASGKRVCDKRYAAPVSVALVSRNALQAADLDPADQPPEVRPLRFALASCRYAAAVTDRELADRSFDRLRDRLDPRREDKPQLLLLAGDQIYADATAGLFDPTLGVERYDQRYLEAWTAPNAREVLRRVPVYPMLDDHEVEENWEGQPASLKPETGTHIQTGLSAFVSYQLLLTPRFGDPLNDGLTRDGYWYCISASGFGFFVADTRTERERGTGSRSVGSSIMKEPQMKALKGWLAAQQNANASKPKFVVSPSVVVPWTRETRGDRAYSLRADAWDAFPDSLHELLGFIANNEICNVVFLSGDYHASIFCEITLSSAGKAPVKAFSVVSSGLYAPYPFVNTRAEALELSYRGTHAHWLGETGPSCCRAASALAIEYAAVSFVTRDSFAVVNVEAHGPQQWRMEVEFDTEDGVVRNVANLS